MAQNLKVQTVVVAGRATKESRDKVTQMLKDGKFRKLGVRNHSELIGTFYDRLSRGEIELK